MEANDCAIKDILAEIRCFAMPLYREKYQWQDTEVDKFWDDIEAKAIDVLECKGKFYHDMGALILAPIGKAAQIGETPKVQIVDGQQRLTTFQLFLAAPREVALWHGCERHGGPHPRREPRGRTDREGQRAQIGNPDVVRTCLHDRKSRIGLTIRTIGMDHAKAAVTLADMPAA